MQVWLSNPRSNNVAMMRKTFSLRINGGSINTASLRMDRILNTLHDNYFLYIGYMQ